MDSTSVPKLGPEPVLLTRKEVDALYETLGVVVKALDKLQVDYIVTGGSLLGAIRQHSILFCDDDIDISILDHCNGGPGDGTAYRRVFDGLQDLLGKDYAFQVKPWEGGDRVRPKRMNNVFIDIFVIRHYESISQLVDQVVGKKMNGQLQSQQYVDNVTAAITKSSIIGDDSRPLSSFWQFATRKAVEMWPKEVYRTEELFPLQTNFKMGPVVGIKGPRTPVLLLKRAFGEDCFDVYYQSASHKENPSQSNNNTSSRAQGPNLPNKKLAPLVSPGGTWEGSTKQPLQDQHYVPMQPTSRAARRPTNFDKAELFRYLEMQSKTEAECLRSSMDKTETGSSPADKPQDKVGTVYMDGVFDLFHVGHLEAIKQCAEIGRHVIIGVTGDQDAAGYKRKPIICEAERTAIIKALRYVDKVICPCPLVVTETFLREQQIDLVVHGFASDADRERQYEFFKQPMETGRFQEIAYYGGQSTSELMQKIQKLDCDESRPVLPQEKERPTRASKSHWFGASLAAATNNSSTIPTDPFPIDLRQIVEPHVQKAVKRRQEALDAISEATGSDIFQSTISQFHESRLAKEGDLTFDPATHPLHSSFLESAGLSHDYDLSNIHKESCRKEEVLEHLCNSYEQFQTTYDSFVREFCAPHMAQMFDCDEVYYQCFPCIRMVRPDEFSIGPHSDVAYGHHPCSVNYYVPLTYIGGSSALFLESRPNGQDWHPIVGSLGHVKHFAGAMCTHWTTDNTTTKTRVSIDFRLIPGPMFHKLKCGGLVSGGQKDVYREKDGYYSVCKRARDSDGTCVWAREGPVLKPDARVGFPWTVKNWEKVKKKLQQSNKS